MRFAFADPPYLGCGKLYPGHPDARDWDDPETHRALISRLTAYDGWALSTGSKQLPTMLAMCPPDVRVAAWVKPFHASSSWRGTRVSYGWEPVIFRGGHPDDGSTRTKDFLVANMATQRGLTGAKPEAFCRWVLDLLGYTDGDTLDDLFPGTGVMSAVMRQGILAMESGEEVTVMSPSFTWDRIRSGAGTPDPR